MSNGALGKAMTVNAAFVTPYTVPANALFATITVSMVNQGTTDAKFRLALTTNPTPTPQDYVEYDAIIPANGGIFERSCTPVSANEKVMVFCDSASVAVRVSGLEELP